MLETFYNTFGFSGSLLVAFTLFIFFIFWVAGLAGICRQNRKPRQQNIRITVAVLFPVYPFLWMIWEMISQRKQMRRN